jgi:hypothetical protein
MFLTSLKVLKRQRLKKHILNSDNTSESKSMNESVSIVSDLESPIFYLDPDQ